MGFNFAVRRPNIDAVLRLPGVFYDVLFGDPVRQLGFEFVLKGWAELICLQ